MSKEYSGQFEVMFYRNSFECSSLKKVLQSASTIYFTVHTEIIEKLLANHKQDWINNNHYPSINIIVSEPNPSIRQEIKKSLEEKGIKISIHFYPSPFQHMVVTENIVYVHAESAVFEKKAPLPLTAILTEESDIVNFFVNQMKRYIEGGSLTVPSSKDTSSSLEDDLLYMRDSTENLISSLETMLEKQKSKHSMHEKEPMITLPSEEISLFTWTSKLSSFAESLDTFHRSLKTKIRLPAKYTEEIKDIRKKLCDIQEELLELIPFLPASLPLIEDYLQGQVISDEMSERFPGIYDHQLGEEDNFNSNQENYMNLIAQSLALIQEPTNQSEKPMLHIRLLEETHHHLANTAYLLNKLAFYWKV